MTSFQYFFYNPITYEVSDKDNLIEYLTENLINPSTEYAFVVYLVNASFAFLTKVFRDFYKMEADDNILAEASEFLKYLNTFENSIFRISIRF